jgi:hypothetical protein
MTDISSPPMSSRQQPWDWAEGMSDANPADQGVYTMGDGSLHAYPPAGSVSQQLGISHVPLTHATSEGTAATRNAQAYGSYGAAPEGPVEVTRVSGEPSQ